MNACARLDELSYLLKSLITACHADAGPPMFSYFTRLSQRSFPVELRFGTTCQMELSWLPRAVGKTKSSREDECLCQIG